MKKKRDITYSLFQQQIKNKDVAVNQFIQRTLAQTQSMFKYDGLPDSIPQTVLERQLQENGSCFVTRIGDKLYSFTGAAGGETDVYFRPTIYTVANPAMNINRNFRVFAADGEPTDEGVLIKNDTNGESLYPLIGKFAVLYTDGLISLNTASVLTRITMLISASDDRTKQSADEFLKRIIDGDFSIIGENAFFKGVNLQTAPTANSTYITQLIELVQYFKASMYNELGLNANYNMKRERLNLGEVSMNVDILLPYVDNMLNERKKAVERINELYGTEISVDLASTWKLNHENYEKMVADVETPDNPLNPDETPSDTDTDVNDNDTDVNDNDTDVNDNDTDVNDTDTDGNDTDTDGNDSESDPDNEETKKENDDEN